MQIRSLKDNILLRAIVIIFLLIVSFINQASSQSLIRSSLSCLGSSMTLDGFLVRQTIGQPSSTFIFKQEGIVLRQGFQQAVLPDNSALTTQPIDFTIYPNPAVNETEIKLNERLDRYTIIIRGFDGGLISMFEDEILAVRRMDLKGFASGIYFITIVSDKRIGTKKLVVI